MELFLNGKYTHIEHGDVVVLSIHRAYTSYETTTDDGEEMGVFVQYTSDWDEYGPMPSGRQESEIEGFVDGITEYHGTLTFEEPGSTD